MCLSGAFSFVWTLHVNKHIKRKLLSCISMYDLLPFLAPFQRPTQTHRELVFMRNHLFVFLLMMLHLTSYKNVSTDISMRNVNLLGKRLSLYIIFTFSYIVFLSLGHQIKILSFPLLNN